MGPLNYSRDVGARGPLTRNAQTVGVRGRGEHPVLNGVAFAVPAWPSDLWLKSIESGDK